MRNAGTPTMRPRIVAPIAPKIGEIGNGIPVSKAIFPNMNLQFLQRQLEPRRLVQQSLSERQLITR